MLRILRHPLVETKEMLGLYGLITPIAACIGHYNQPSTGWVATSLLIFVSAIYLDRRKIEILPVTLGLPIFCLSIIAMPASIGLLAGLVLPIPSS